SRRGGRAGLFEVADGGTLFLDEIGEMPVSLQTRLLRVLEDRAIVRIGGYKPITVDVRVICATHNDLDNRVVAGTFRADLFYRLGVLRLQLPALRDRGADILLLTEKLLKLAFAELDLPLHRGHLQQILACSDFFYHYRWPGNARELRNLMERVALYCSAYPDKIITESLLLKLSPERRTVIAPAPVTDLPPEPVNTATATEAVARFRGDRRAAADWLGISRTTLWRRLKQEQNTSS
ncbi:TPA: sigma 54-interacting transcriptional regulator, partial [Morganella morganii]|nr:sigma 54-interacting transcriptional regulator [Morganella morganii]